MTKSKAHTKPNEDKLFLVVVNGDVFAVVVVVGGGGALLLLLRAAGLTLLVLVLVVGVGAPFSTSCPTCTSGMVWSPVLPVRLLLVAAPALLFAIVVEVASA